MLRTRLLALNAIFGVLLIAIALGAIATALATTGPWFSPEVSMQTYGVSLVGATVLTAVLAAVAAGIRSRLDESLRSLDLRLAALPEAIGLQTDDEGTPLDLSSIPPSDEEVDDLLEVLESAPPASGIAELQITGTLVEVSSALTAARIRRELLKAVVRQRSEVLAARRRVASLAAGPIFAGIVFAAVAGPMLPGVGGFAVRNFQMNTAAVLFLGYGAFVLLAWAVLAIGGLVAGPRKP